MESNESDKSLMTFPKSLACGYLFALILHLCYTHGNSPGHVRRPSPFDNRRSPSWITFRFVNSCIWLWLKPGERGRVVFEIEDRGPGIPTSERRSIFRPFHRGAAHSDSGGIGLGLSLAKQWAELYSGTITYRPADGGTGACFRLELPVG